MRFAHFIKVYLAFGVFISCFHCLFENVQTKPSCFRVGGGGVVDPKCWNRCTEIRPTSCQRKTLKVFSLYINNVLKVIVKEKNKSQTCDDYFIIMFLQNCFRHRCVGLCSMLTKNKKTLWLHGMNVATGNDKKNRWNILVCGNETIYDRLDWIFLLNLFLVCTP